MSEQPIEHPTARIDVESGVTTSGRGFVVMRWGDLSGQLTPDEAREYALAILEAADAADHDAALFVELRDRVGLELTTIGGLLRGIREQRARQVAARGSASSR